MSFTRRPGPAEIGRSSPMEAEENIRVFMRGDAALRQIKDSDGEASDETLNGLLGRVSEISTLEVDNLIDELQRLRRRLQTDSNRIQSDIAKYTALSEQVMQLTKIISESMQKLPDAPNISA
jgi:hypothetical protein